MGAELCATTVAIELGGGYPAAYHVFLFWVQRLLLIVCNII